MQDKSLFIPLQTKRAFDEISDQVTKLIYQGVFKPGDKLPSERELASQFNAGRMVVREALRILEQSGFVCIKHGSAGGAFVKEIDSTVMKKSISDMLGVGNITIQNLTEVRMGIEGAILELATFRRNQDDLKLMRESIDNAEQQILRGRRPYERSIEFHLLLAKAAKNPLYEIIIESIVDVMKSFILKAAPDEEYNKKILNHHKVIYKAIENQNIRLAREVLKEHFHDFEKKYLKKRKKT